MQVSGWAISNLYFEEEILLFWRIKLINEKGNYLWQQNKIVIAIIICMKKNF